MKKISSILLLGAMVFGWGLTYAQCNINLSNTTPGFSPNPAPPITQGVAYSQTVQVYVPTTYTVSGITATVDSVHISGMTGLPSGITFVLNPVSGTVVGGGHGAICFSGTSNAPVGSYPITFNGTAYVHALGQPQQLSLSQPPLSTAFTDTFTVQAPQVSASCDTTANVNLNGDTAALFGWQAPGVGWISGSGAAYYPQASLYLPSTAIAERFTSINGDSVTAAFIRFGICRIKSTDSSNLVKFYVYNDAGTWALGTGGPGAAIDSSVLTLKHIARDITNNTFTIVNFMNNAKLTTPTFYVVVQLPSTTGDSLAVVTGTGNTTRGRGYINLPVAGGWYSYSSFAGADSLGNFIGVSICGGGSLPPVAAFVASDTSGCGSLTVNFTDQSTGSPTGYSWSFGDNSANSTVASPSHTYAASGVYTAKETVTGPGGSTTFSVVIDVHPAPTAVAHVTATSASSATGTASVVVTGGTSPYSFSWSNGGSTDTISGLSAGDYNVTVTDAKGCRAILDSVLVTVTGILDLASGQCVTIYPNPATDVLNLIWSQQSNAEISIVDLNGQVVSTQTANGEMKTVCNIHDLAAGAYIIRITDKVSNHQSSMLFSKF